MKKARPQAVLWPTEENFARFGEVCSDIQSETFEAYRTVTVRDIEAQEARGIEFERFEFDPDQLLVFAQAAGFDRVVANIRALYAVALQMKRHGRR